MHANRPRRDLGQMQLTEDDLWLWRGCASLQVKKIREGR